MMALWAANAAGNTQQQREYNELIVQLHVCYKGHCREQGQECAYYAQNQVNYTDAIPGKPLLLGEVGTSVGIGQ